MNVPTVDCGEPLHTALIADGVKAKSGQFPWHVAIYYVPQSLTLICSGTLISTNIVLSGELMTSLFFPHSILQKFEVRISV